MNALQLQQKLAGSSVHLYLDGQGVLRCNAPKGALTPALMQEIATHKQALTAALADTHQPPALRAGRTDRFRASPPEIALWSRYYNACPWYQNTSNDSPFGMALEYATSEQYAICNAISTNRLIWFYERCQPGMLSTPDGARLVDPREFTELLRTAYTENRIADIIALAANFGARNEIEEEIARALTQPPLAPPVADLNEIETGASLDTPPTPPAPPAERKTETKRKRRAIAYADIRNGCAMLDTGAGVSFTPNSSLSEVLQSIFSAGSCNRLYICGTLPENYETWLTDAVMWRDYTTEKRGHYFDKEKAENHVARYQHRVTGDEIEIRTMSSWFGDGAYTVEQAREAMGLLNQHLARAFTEQAKAYATPALTFQSCWDLLNRMEKKQFHVLPDEIRATIRRSSGQGRIELCTAPGLDKIPGLYYYDGVFEYAALTWGMPTELEAHDNKNEHAGKVPARYRIRYTVPADWAHVGLFMTPKEQATGNALDNASWCYPGAAYAGKTFETWADGAELDVLIDHYAPALDMPDNATKEQYRTAKERAYTDGRSAGFAAWQIEIVERIVFKPEKESVNKKPLDTITSRLVRMRAKVEDEARQDSGRATVYKLVRGAIRNILLHGIGSFNRSNRDSTYILTASETAPDGYTNVRPIGNDLLVYTVPQQTEKYTQQFEHPEWAHLIWARCRARMTRAALSLPREAVVAIRTDAIATTCAQPQWATSEKIGTLREKWRIEKTLKAPHNSLDELDKLIQRHVKGEK